jgi:preprotein translocase subunit SecA
MERGVFLNVIDREWQDYLRAMDDLRHGVNLRAYGQRDPLIEYKKEAFSMFEQLMNAIKTKVVTGEFRSTTLTNMRRMMAQMENARRRAQTNESAVSIDGSTGAEEARQNRRAEPAKPATRAENQKAVADVFASMMSRPARVVRAPLPGTVPGAQPAPRHDVVGRNDPCPCGSGKKYKKCCGRNVV